MRLAELQTRFQEGVVNGHRTIFASIKDSRRTDRAILFGVYYDAYRSRLAEFLANDFPILRSHLGEEAFGQLCKDYIESTLSLQPNARWYGTRLPDFMRKTPSWRTNKTAIDLAAFERALSNAFDAPDLPQAGIDSLRDTRQNDWPQLTFDFHPSVMLFDLGGGTARLCEALAQGKQPPVLREGTETVLFWRYDGRAFYRVVAEDERLALVEARQGKRFGEICTLLAFQRNGEDVTQRVAGFLSQWFADGLIAQLSVADYEC
jgi:hypothetical protein